MSADKIIVRTFEGVDVTRRIEDGRTAFFNNKDTAAVYANFKRSYSYPLYNGKNEHIGYGVPK